MVHVSTLREEEGSERLVVYLERPPLPGRGTRRLGCTVADFPLTGMPRAVRQAGETLYTRLAEHQEFSTALVQALQIANNGRCPLFIHLDPEGEADRIPWETLCAPDGTFVSLEPRWSVARVVDSRTPTAGTVTFRPPLRIAALLSSLDVPAADEWAALRDAASASPVPVEILAMIGEPDLETQIAEAEQPGVTVMGIPGPEDDDELRSQLATFKPHILHFFCHGSTAGGAHLELATQSDWRTGATVSSLFLEPNQVAALGDRLERPWLAMLNCCEGAAAEGEIHSLASDLVYAGGFPAVVGMREPIKSDDAHQFSDRFYPALFDALQDTIQGASGVLDWSQLLVEPRRALVQRRGGVFTAVAAERREWTLPVLYMRSDQFHITAAAPADPGDLLMLAMYRSMRVTVTASSPDSYVAELDRLIADLERRVAGS
jgi:hypothetical protein